MYGSSVNTSGAKGRERGTRLYKGPGGYGYVVLGANEGWGASPTSSHPGGMDPKDFSQMPGVPTGSSEIGFWHAHPGAYDTRYGAFEQDIMMGHPPEFANLAPGELIFTTLTILENGMGTTLTGQDGTGACYDFTHGARC